MFGFNAKIIPSYHPTSTNLYDTIVGQNQIFAPLLALQPSGVPIFPHLFFASWSSSACQALDLGVLCRIIPAQRDMLQLLMMWMLIFVLVFLVHETQFWMCLHPNNNPQQRLFKENRFKLQNHDSHNHAEFSMFCSI